MQDAQVDAVDDVSTDHSAMERLYREEGSRLLRTMLAFTGDADLASDTVMEAFAQLLRRADAVRDPGRWIWRAAFRIAAGDLQHRGRHMPLTVDPSYEMVEEDDDLIRALATPSPVSSPSNLRDCQQSPLHS